MPSPRKNRPKTKKKTSKQKASSARTSKRRTSATKKTRKPASTSTRKPATRRGVKPAARRTAKPASRGAKTKPASHRSTKPASRGTTKPRRAASGPLLKKRERKKVLGKMRRKEIPPPQPAAPFIDPAQTIQEKGEPHPISLLESHRIKENQRRREEAAFRAENQKAKNILASRKNLKRTYRMFGNR